MDQISLAKPRIRFPKIKAKLTRDQRRMAELVFMGHQMRDIAKAFSLPYGRFIRLKDSPAFQRHLARLDRQEDETIQYKLRRLWFQTCTTLEKMMKSDHFASQQFAIEQVFKLRGITDRTLGPPPVNGNGVNVNLVSQSISLDQLAPEKKEHVKELLRLTAAIPDAGQDEPHHG